MRESSYVRNSTVVRQDNIVLQREKKEEEKKTYGVIRMNTSPMLSSPPGGYVQARERERDTQRRVTTNVAVVTMTYVMCILQGIKSKNENVVMNSYIFYVVEHRLRTINIDERERELDDITEICDVRTATVVTYNGGPTIIRPTIVRYR